MIRNKRHVEIYCVFSLLIGNRNKFECVIARLHIDINDPNKMLGTCEILCII